MVKWLSSRSVTLAIRVVLLAVLLIAVTTSGSSPVHAPKAGTPLCGPSVKSHHLGTCLPNPPGRPHFGAGGGITGPDLSNNDPVFGDGNWAAIAARNKFAYFKSVEGTGFTDSTAATMAVLAKRHALPVGGYDFLHVCWVSATAEADHFVAQLNAQGLLGAGTLPPAADAEYGSGSCGGFNWLQTWTNEVYNRDGHVCPIMYTGQWWYGPNVTGWPSCGGLKIKSWYSGYGVSWPFTNSAYPHVDIWQDTDHGFNGAINSDMSIWEDGQAAFDAWAHGVPVDPYVIFQDVTYDLGHNIKADEKTIVKGWNDRNCFNPTKRPVCGFLHYRLKLLDGRIIAVANRSHPADYSTGHRLKRAKYIEYELAMTHGPRQAPPGP